MNWRLPFWEDRSCAPGPSWNLFWDDPGLNVRYLWIFQFDHIFYKLGVKIFATNNEIRCVRCSYPPSSSSALDPCQQKPSLILALAKEGSGTSLKINAILTGKTVFSIQYKNLLKEKIDRFWPFSYVYIFNFYTFYCHIVKSADVWKMWFIK